MSSGQGAGDAVDRRAIVAERMTAQTVAGETVTTVVLLGRLCRAAADQMSAVGAAVGLMSESGSAGVVASADERSFELDELQFSLGEGPSHDAFTMRRPVLIADMDSSEGRAWPIYGAGALEWGVTGVFAFPLHIGAAAFGVLTIYAGDGRPMDQEQLNMALAYAEVATELLLDGDFSPSDGSLHPGVERVLTNRAEIYQAQGSVMAQLGISLPEALVRMRAHAFSQDQSLAELAALIMSGEVVLGLTTGE
jgi:hypothetical protein